MARLLGAHRRRSSIWRGDKPVPWARFGRLRVCLPPWANWIAAKLVRGDPRDVEDAIYVAGNRQVTAEQGKACASEFPEPARQQVLENVVYLRILEP
jgi:hypothetical protein